MTLRENAAAGIEISSDQHQVTRRVSELGPWIVARHHGTSAAHTRDYRTRDTVIRTRIRTRAGDSCVMR